jgi:N utilization substance protein B
MISRRKAREFALQILYAAEMGDASLESVAAGLSVEPPVAPEAQAYGLKLANRVIKEAEIIDARLIPAAENWDFDRYALVDKLVLRLAVAELLFEDDVPPKVCINEAVEIARKFSTEKSGAFVNGVLDAVARSLGSLAPKAEKGTDGTETGT